MLTVVVDIVFCCAMRDYWQHFRWAHFQFDLNNQNKLLHTVCCLTVNSSNSISGHFTVHTVFHSGILRVKDVGLALKHYRNHIFMTVCYCCWMHCIAFLSPQTNYSAVAQSHIESSRDWACSLTGNTWGSVQLRHETTQSSGGAGYRQRENDSGKPDHARRPRLTRGAAHVRNPQMRHSCPVCLWFHEWERDSSRSSAPLWPCKAGTGGGHASDGLF